MIYNSELKRFGGIFDYDTKRTRLEEVKQALKDPDLWKTPQRAKQLSKENTELETVVTGLDRYQITLSDSQALLEIAKSEEDTATIAEIAQDLKSIEKSVGALEFQRMFPGEMDKNNAYLDIQAGSGGTEAQDWAEMLLRMYLRWGERRGFKTELIEVSPGEVAGIKSATIKVEGAYIYGLLRTETGVHRLVRKSPFDSGNRRHTSFAAVLVSPEAKLYEFEIYKQKAEQQKIEESKSDIGWGNQIRSYVLDQSRVKDLRTNIETGNTQAVLDGEIDFFIEAALKMGIQ